MADDERLLASLVLLLRLSPDAPAAAPAGEEIGKTAAGGAGFREEDAPSPLQDAWEGNEGELLCFAGRLVRHYANCDEGGTASATGGVYLRLAARAAFLRYAPHFHEMDVQRDDKTVPSSERIRTYERGLSTSILSALRARASEAMEEVDVEMAWVAQRLAVRLSSGSGAKSTDQEVKSSHSNVWTETIDAMAARRCKKTGDVPFRIAASKDDATSTQNDEQLMVQTLNAILDGNAPPDAGADGGGKREDWATQYDASLMTCLQAYLQLHLQARESENGGGEEPLPLWTQRALFGMVRWSQQNHTLSLEAYRLALQYLRLCIPCFGSGGPSLQQRSLAQYYASCVARGDGAENNSLEGAEEFATAIRSFVFHGLLVLANAAADASKAMAEANTSKNALPTPSSTELRGDIYSLVLELWQVFGPEWIMTNTTGASANDWWWFPSGGKENEHQLGATWPLCTLVRLAAGEFRLGLGRFMAFLEREETSTDDKDAELISEIDACAGIVAEATRLMTSIAEDEDSLSSWSPDAILHIRTSLEDALNSTVQYFNSLPEESMKRRGSGSDEIGRSCCLVMGTIAAELEADHLFAPPSLDASPSADKERGSSLFSPALGSAIRFCDSIGNCGDAVGTIPYERQEPLAYLLPCIMSLVSNAASQQGEGKASEGMELALTNLQQGNCLVLALSGFLRRAASQLRESAQGGIPTIQSMVQLCALIVDEYTQIAPEADSRELRRCLALFA
ncbi:hypothetical protein ACHAXT_010734 [Thalassiosira profunda]